MSSGDSFGRWMVRVQLVELAGEAERRLVILIGYRRSGIGTHVEVLIPLQEHRDGLFHFLRRYNLAVDLEIAGSALSQPGI